MLQSLGKILVDSFVAGNTGRPRYTGDNFISGLPISTFVAGKRKEFYSSYFDTKTVAVFKLSISVMVS